jgi:hypothetical protein
LSRDVTRERKNAQQALNALAGGTIKYETPQEAAKAQTEEIMTGQGATWDETRAARAEIDRLVDPTISEVHARVVEILAEFRLEIAGADVALAEADVEAARTALTNAQTAAAAALTDPIAQGNLQIATDRLQEAEAALSAAEKTMEAADEATDLAGLGAERSQLASNVRRRLAFYFHPKNIQAKRTKLQEPDYNQLDLRRTDQPLATHLGVNLEWKH